MSRASGANQRASVRGTSTQWAAHGDCQSRREHTARGWMPLLLLLALTVVTSCGHNRSTVATAGDPGDVQLRQLRAESIFAAFPPMVELSGPILVTGARKRTPAFQASGYDGPSVEARFTSSAPPTLIFDYYAKQTVKAGWSPSGNRNTLGYPEGWFKTLPGGARASLSLTDLNIANTSQGASTYILSGSA